MTEGEIDNRITEGRSFTLLAAGLIRTKDDCPVWRRFEGRGKTEDRFAGAKEVKYIPGRQKIIKDEVMLSL